ncbi:MAG TPA: hypothetical protein VM600_02805 [Actinomycetota bacterium]|nr:hypothetical protein [Actinomycetota bacterium]
MAGAQRWQEQEEIVARFTTESDAAETVKELQLAGLLDVGMRIDDDGDRMAGLAGEVNEGPEIVTNPGPLLPGVTKPQIVGSIAGSLAMGAGFLVVGGLISVVLAALDVISWPVALGIALIAAFTGATFGMVAGGKAGGEYEMARDEVDHTRTFVVRVRCAGSDMQRARAILKDNGGAFS